jgi:hypothetical protein
MDARRTQPDALDGYSLLFAAEDWERSGPAIPTPPGPQQGRIAESGSPAFAKATAAKRASLSMASGGFACRQ